MQATRNDSNRSLLLWSAAIVVGNFLAVVWHLVLLIKVQPSTPGFLPRLLILLNLLPIAGVLVFAKGLPRLAAGAILLPLSVGLVIGAYSHFLSSGSDNVLRMPPGPLRLTFQLSAMLLVILEGLGCWVGFRMLTYVPMKRALRT
jgi:hypothetical protein